MKKKLGFLFLFFFFSISPFFAQLQITANATITQLVNSLAGSGATITNPTLVCPTGAYGTFTNGNLTNLGINGGVLLTTGTAATGGPPPVTGVNAPASSFASTDNTGAGNNLLTGIAGATTYEECRLEFDITPSCATLQMSYVFGSEEYPEFVNQGFNDAFGFFITGPNPGGGTYNNVNIANVPGSGNPVTIDNINSSLNSQYYIDNSGSSTIVYDGLTTPLTASVSVTPCAIYHMILVIADGGDGIYDSGVFLTYQGLTCPSPVVSASGSQTICPGGSATLSASGMTNYTWSPGGQTGPNITVTPTVTTTYTVTGTQGLCNTSTATLTVTVASPSSTASNSGPYCQGSTVSLTATGGGTYSWSGPGGFTSNSQNPSITNSTNGMSGVYSVTVTNGSCTSTATTSVTVSSAPIATASNSGPFCDGQTISLSGGGGSSYNWSGPGGFTSTSQNPSITGANSGMSGVYTVTVSIGTCTAVNTTTVIINPSPTITTNTITICSGGSGILVASGGTSYTWSSGTTPLSADQDSVSVSSTTPVTYTVTGTDANGCTNTAFASVLINSNSITVTASNNDTICAGANTTVSVNTSNPASFIWLPGNATTATLTVTPSVTTTYTVNAIDANGCTGSDTVTVLVAQPITITPATGSVSCNNTCDGQASVSVNPPSGPFANYTYSWSNGSTASSAGNNLCAGNYTVTITDAAGCSTTQTITVNQPQPVTISGSVTDVLCNGGQTGSASVITSGGTGTYTVSWSNSGSGITQNNLGAGIYTAIVTDGNGCTANTQVIISEPSALSLTLSAQALDCNNPTGSVASIISGGTPNYSFAWSPQGSGQNPSGLPAGTYTATVTDANGCVITQTTTISSSIASPNVSAGNSDTLGCGPNASLSLSGSSSTAGVAYSWSGPNGFSSTQANPSVSNPGMYILTVTDPSNGCTSTDTVVIDQTFINAAFTLNPPTGQYPLPVQFTNTSSNATNYFWSFGNGSTSTSVNDTTVYLSPSTYTVMLIATNSFGCVDTAYATVLVTDVSFILIPNIFSPNGDNVNDLLTIQSEGIISLEMDIFDRWGLVVAKVTNVNGGWDGKSENGNDSPDGTYYYIVKAKGVDGKDYGVEGYFMLVR